MLIIFSQCVSDLVRLWLRVSVIDERKAENGAFARDVAGWSAVQS